MAKGARDHEGVLGFIRSGGSTQQDNITVTDTATEITYATPTTTIFIQNLSGQFVQFSFDDGVTFTDINPYQSVQAEIEISAVKIKRTDLSGDAKVQVLASLGKA